MAKPFVTSVITGAKSLDQIEQNLAARGLKLDADDLATLDAVSRLAPEYPGWMHERTAPTRMPSGTQIKPNSPPSSSKS
ncbi:aldo/keto reductase [Glaciimonas sp. CA11.2]|uniref:hypothetical protein n=1 Tax=Glaciimonas sp. CA11.2 TaxID=3048601 RepID=UPI002B23381E|nr:hypothetical protein [Glaciimonas sp. CA11.2]MEB0164028.1 aldo/keto reductase [Glaciimonas sp. CA11.2]